MAYIYYSYEQFGRGYIGFRNCDPEGDEAYMGSFRDRSFQPTEKIILATFAGAHEALSAEIALHEFFDVARNPHFANRARQTSTTFTTAGTTQTEESNRKRSVTLRGVPHSKEWCKAVTIAKRKKWPREAWEELERNIATGAHHIGARAVCRKFDVSRKRVGAMIALIRKGYTFEEAMAGADA